MFPPVVESPITIELGDDDDDDDDDEDDSADEEDGSDEPGAAGISGARVTSILSRYCDDDSDEDDEDEFDRAELPGQRAQRVLAAADADYVAQLNRVMAAPTHA